MKDVITCPDCGGQLIRESELEDLYLCDVCGLRKQDGYLIRFDAEAYNKEVMILAAQEGQVAEDKAFIERVEASCSDTTKKKKQLMCIAQRRNYLELPDTNWDPRTLFACVVFVPTPDGGCEIVKNRYGRNGKLGPKYTALLRRGRLNIRQLNKKLKRDRIDHE